LSVYLNFVMILNFLVDFLLILGTNRLSGFPPDWGRSALAAAVGGLYSGLCMIPGFHFMMNILWRITSLLVMSAVAFGGSSMLRRGGIFVLLSLALGGVAAGFGNESYWMPVIAVGILWLLCRSVFSGGAGGKEYVPVRITHEGNMVSVIALKDSGNSLRDPVTGESVMVIGAQTAMRLIGLNKEQLSSPMETLTGSSIRGLRLIPYRSVGGSGMLLAKRFPNVQIGDRKGSALVAFAPEAIGRGEGYQALTGGAL
jgi:stage II sporulation protein GA (sporulation sigma-E factor processing peptidase)